MKKKFVIISIIASLILVACGDDPVVPNPPHSHNVYIKDFGEYHAYYCDCNEIKRDEDHIKGSFISNETLKEVSGDISTYYYSCPLCGHIFEETFSKNTSKSYTLLPSPNDTTFDALANSYLDGQNISPLVKVLVGTLMGSYINALIKKDLDSETPIEGDVTLRKIVYSYTTSYINGEEIELSASITYPLFKGVPVINAIDIDNHPTFVDASEAISKDFDIFAITALTGCAVIETDLIGFGLTEDMPADYMCSHLATRNTVDSVLAGFEVLKNEVGLDPTGLHIFNTGYSQGGYDALALLKYMETEATNSEKEKINFTKTFAGSGPYDLKIMTEDSLANPNFEYCEYVLMALITSYYYHNDIMGGLFVEDFLTEEGVKYIKPILDKDAAALQLLKNNPCTPSEFFNSEFLNLESDLYRVLVDYALSDNILDDTWLPNGDLMLFYTTADELVSPNCSRKAEELFKDLSNVEVNGENSGSHSGAAIYYFLDVLSQISDILMEIIYSE